MIRYGMWDILSLPDRAAREWKNDNVASIVYMIQDRDLNNNVDTDDILSLLAERDTEYCMDTLSTFHMK